MSAGKAGTTIAAWLAMLLPCAADADVDLDGYRLTQQSSSQEFTFPATVVPPGAYVIVSRSADQGAFETFWGVTLGSDVHFLNSGGVLPQINGDESYELLDATAASLDGPTVAMTSGGQESVARVAPDLPADQESSWSRNAVTSATPGSGAAPSSGAGLVISEFSDAAGAGNFVYEFVELYNDEPPAVPSMSRALQAALASLLGLLGWCATRRCAAHAGAPGALRHVPSA